MEPISHSAKSLRSGLLRLRTWYLHRVWQRSTVTHVLTHVSLFLFLHPALLSLGVPGLLADVVIAFIAVVLAHAINDYLDRAAGE